MDNDHVPLFPTSFLLLDLNTFTRLMVFAIVDINHPPGTFSSWPHVYSQISWLFWVPPELCAKAMYVKWLQQRG